MSDGRRNIVETISGEGFRRFRGGTVGRGEESVLAVVDPKKLSVKVEAGASARMVVLHTEAGKCAADIELAERASLSVTEVFLRECFAEVTVRQQGGSRCEFAMAELCGANAAFRAELDGEGAEWLFHGVFAGTDSDRCAVSLNTRHNVAGCKSGSMVKGVVSGRASGEFRGLVYVAPDAQRTDARQQSRNIELGRESHISTLPQLEIYADDVKCSHGATVGHRDEEALFYMQQRGLSEKDAQRLQIEGFVKDVVMKCPVEALREALGAEIDAKLEKL